jgi:uncharacterized protein YabN with tetrapyrrole methylase and pyrophosphatase domain
VTVAGSLTVVGTGIRLAGQMTLEALEQVKHAERVFYLAGDMATARWLQQLNPTAESLFDCYAEGRPRADSYTEMVARVLQAVRAGQRVAAAFYGHPGVGVDPAHRMIKQARQEGYRAQMLPGVSAEACLVADLGVDPLLQGWQSYEAWAFVAQRPRFDPRHALVLWQVGLVYQQSISFSGALDPRGLPAVASALKATYPPSHRVVLYEASPFPVSDPRIEPRRLKDLTKASVSTATTLFVPPLTKRRTR